MVESHEIAEDLGGGKKRAKKGIEFEPYPFYLSAWEEDQYIVAQANAPIDANGHFRNDRVLVRRSPQAASLADLPRLREAQKDKVFTLEMPTRAAPSLFWAEARSARPAHDSRRYAYISPSTSMPMIPEINCGIGSTRSPMVKDDVK